MKLPKRLREKTISEMLIGESGWTVPWAMYANNSGECFLNGKYTVHDMYGGTVKMHISRDTYGFDVFVPRGYKYSLGANYVGGATPLPVISISDSLLEY